VRVIRRQFSRAEQWPTYNAYRLKVTSPGRAGFCPINRHSGDYEQLDRWVFSVKGAIVIAKYGHSWRGIKPKVGAEHGDGGC